MRLTGGFGRSFIVAMAVAGASFVASSSYGDSQQALVEAAKEGNTQALRALLQKQADVNAPAPDGTTALHWAAHHGDLDTVSLLVRRGANVRAANRFGITPLWLASVDGNAAVVDALLTAGADANTMRGDSGETVLMIAARSGHANVVKSLLAHGANPNVVEPTRSQTALMWAAAEHHPAVVKLLIEARADTKATSATKMTPLMFAIRAGDLESVRALVDSGLDVNSTAADGTSMLVLAILNTRFDVGAFLLDRGADANFDDPHGRPLHVLAFLRRANNRSLSVVIPRQMPMTGLDSIGMAKALLAHGADINARFKLNPGAGSNASNNGMFLLVPRNLAVGAYRQPFTGATPFYIAAITSDAPLMRFLAANGANASLGTVMGITPLLAAAGIGFWEGEHPGTQAEAFEAVKVAYELGNDPKAIVEYGDQKGDPMWQHATAMHGAANRGADDMVRWLAEKGVPLDAKSQRGVSPWHIAAGLDGGLFHAWPQTADLIVKLAQERGQKIDMSDPPAPTGPSARPAATVPAPKASENLAPATKTPTAANGTTP